VQRSNDPLRALLAEAGWTGEQLARAVNTAAAEAGVPGTCDRTAVSHWLAGRWPRPPVPELLAEALSRGLGRPVAVADFAPRSRSATQSRPGIEMLASLARVQSSGRRKPSAYSLELLTDLRTGAPVAALDVTADPDTGTRLSADQVAATEAMATLFAAGDAAFGGGHSRQALSAYLAQDVLPRLRAAGGAAVRRRMFISASQLAYLCGFMCYDDELHGVAQRYFAVSLGLARESADQASHAITLRAMSVQARQLGHFRDSVGLAEASVANGAGLEPGRQAFLYGQLAVAHAADGARAEALSCLATAERFLDRASSAATSVLTGAYHPAALYHQQAVVCALLGDRKAAVASLSHSARHRPAAERRSGAIILARLAEMQLSCGHVEESTVTWHRFLDDYGALQSGRATTALRNLRAGLRPYGANPLVRVLLSRAASLR
jgi:transcriptional regulator with XRE-family HTH domain